MYELESVVKYLVYNIGVSVEVVIVLGLNFGFRYNGNVV